MKIPARFTTKFQKRQPSLTDGVISFELMRSKIKIEVVADDGRKFWAFVDPLELVEVSLNVMPVVRAKEVLSLDVLESFLLLKEE